MGRWNTTSRKRRAASLIATWPGKTRENSPPSLARFANFARTWARQLCTFRYPPPPAKSSQTSSGGKSGSVICAGWASRTTSSSSPGTPTPSTSTSTSWRTASPTPARWSATGRTTSGRKPSCERSNGITACNGWPRASRPSAKRRPRARSSSTPAPASPAPGSSSSRFVTRAPGIAAASASTRSDWRRQA